MSYVVNSHLNNLYVLSNKAVVPGKKSKTNKRRANVYSGGVAKKRHQLNFLLKIFSFFP